MKVQDRSSLEPLLIQSGPDTFDESRLVMTSSANSGVMQYCAISD